MNADSTSEPTSAFLGLTPDRVVGSVEAALGVPMTALCRPLSSYVNRVFELQQRDGQFIIAKFYRPGRWSRDAILDEHDFLLDLVEEDISVIAPLALKNGETLADDGPFHFAVFPKKGGRSSDEFNLDQWQELGRLIARVHRVGARSDAPDRTVLAPDVSLAENLEAIVSSGLLEADQARSYEQVVERLIDVLTPRWADIEMLRIHGDCHFANVIQRPGEGMFLIDFDDMAIGPPVQDMWLLLPGRAHECELQISAFLSGYETFRDFDRRTLDLIEPLRAMRFVHYSAWCTRQYVEDGEARAAEDFGSRTYWNTEIRDLQTQLQRIEQGEEL